jgi:Kef-type K+ transport system membrane component KefB/CBS domain-containing protein
MNTLFLIGISVFFGTLGGKIFQRLRIPQVVGYIILGVVIGESVLGLLQVNGTEAFRPLINFTLGIIGFLIGGELKGEIFKKYGRSIYLILVSEGMLAFICVCVAVTLITRKLYLGLLFGAIASATDPASTVNVLWEYKARGPLTTTLTSIVALDDGLALILYGLVSVFSMAMITNESYTLWSSIGLPIVELIKCLGLGMAAGMILVKFIERFKEELMLSLVLGGIAAIVGLSVALHLDLILTSMVMGAVIINAIPRIGEKLFKRIKDITIPLYVFFFIFVGASLDIRVFSQVSVIIVVLVYLFSRSAGKIFGAMFGASVSGAKETVAKYSGICLFTQGGVAIGLAMSIAHNLSRPGAGGEDIGAMIINVVAATTFIVQLVGPIFVKFGITRADEVWRNVTEEDIIKSSKVRDFMRTDFSSLKENATLDKIMETIKERESYHFPVVDRQGELTGLISLGNLRSVFREAQLDKVILAKDVAVPVGRLLCKDQPLKDAFEIFNRREIEYLPVVESDRRKVVVGILEYHSLVEAINRKLFERQKSLD